MSKVKVLWKVFSFLFFDKRLEPIRQIVNEAEGFNVAGHRKQPWVMNNAVTKFPDAKRKDIATMVELALQIGEVNK